MDTQEYITFIRKKLHKLEVEKGITVLYAAVCGSRSYGLDSPTSDCDAKFIFVYPMDRYLNLTQPPDHIECEDDLSGYELRKFLGIIRKSGFNAYEMLRGHVIIGDYEDLENLRELEYLCRNPKKFVSSYVGCVLREKSKISKLDEDDDLLGMTKCVLSAARLYMSGYICMHDGPPPILFDSLVKKMEAFDVFSNDMLDALRIMANDKRNKTCSFTREELQDFMSLILLKNDTLFELNKNVKDTHGSLEADARLNNYFRNVIGVR